jgi:hypothetical protein
MSSAAIEAHFVTYIQTHSNNCIIRLFAGDEHGINGLAFPL